MRLTMLLGLLLLVPAGEVWAQAEERTVYASVLDKNDAPVTGLQAGEFVVRENDVTREVLRVSAATEPMQIALIVDTSQAIESHIADLRNALTTFIKQMGGKHEIALIGSGERPTTLVELTRDAARLEKGVGSIFSRIGSGTEILEAIVETSEAMLARKTARAHIIVYTARGREFGSRSHQTVLESLRASGATLHTMALNRPGTSLGTSEEQELEFTFANGTRMTGGRREDLLTPMALTLRLQSLAAELENQHRVVYARPRTLLPPESLEVTAKRPGLTIRARRWP